ncbi:hypothetical protein C8R43DRAFT_307576 [Mycena crocata]|nr:hypothetical protein C8R43DRAFT_307576 [Mycena crocata]
MLCCMVLLSNVMIFALFFRRCFSPLMLSRVATEFILAVIKSPIMIFARLGFHMARRFVEQNLHSTKLSVMSHWQPATISTVFEATQLLFMGQRLWAPSFQV